MNANFNGVKHFMVIYSYVVGLIFFLFTIAMFLYNIDVIRENIFHGKDIENKFVTLLLAISSMILAIFESARVFFEKDTAKSRKKWTITAAVLLLLVMIFTAGTVIVYISGFGYGKDWGNLADVLAYLTVGYFHFTMMVRINENKAP